MPKLFSKTRLIILALLLAGFVLVLLGICLGVTLSYLWSTTIQETQWETVVDGKPFRLRGHAVVETKDTPPFAAHLEPYQKKTRCNCIIDPEDQLQSGGLGGGIGYGKEIYHWKFPRNPDAPFSFRSFTWQPLIRQKVINRMGYTTLDWNITIDGFVSEDGKFYYLSLLSAGGNFANCEVDYYVDFDTATQRLTLHIREKLYRDKYKRYQFDFVIEDDKVPSDRSRGEGEIRSVFVPVSENLNRGKPPR